METKTTHNKQSNRFLKLSLKKSRPKPIQDIHKEDKNPDIIVLDESFDRLRNDFPSPAKSSQKLYSPITINDSCEMSFNDDLPKINFNDHEPSRNGNISFNCSREETSATKKGSRPSIGGWSPAQHIICATPKHDPTPSSPRDVANESHEQCSLKKIHLSQKKILNDLYGEQWKSIPKLFKAIKANCENYDTISKKLQFDEDESDKENIRHDLKQNKILYLTDSEAKRRVDMTTDSERKSKKKLYTEKVPSTPEVGKIKPRNVASTTKKTKVNKAMSVTEMVEVMNNDVDVLTKKVQNVCVAPAIKDDTRLSFIGSLADDIPSYRCNVEALQYHDNYKNLKEQLARRLFVEFNKNVFDNVMEADLPILWDPRFRTTAGTTTNRMIKNAKGERIRTSTIKLSTKVLDRPQRLRDTLIHELCHAATWLIDFELKAGHGPLWNKWAKRALKVYPELGEISRCHDMQIHYKYSYKCTKCGYSVNRHSKSIDITKKCCGYCHGKFELVLNKKNKDGVVVSTRAKKPNYQDFSMHVNENYSKLNDGTRTYGEVMKILAEPFL
ncbi:unnamed protein product [Spodoptera littoralis]|uniref:SprT-like domain-containing protein n=1 Tax=Spodoptera littoralis TaxID=7109 RepID=A0A9P0IBV4_SPOLI|nr:unnamed protein product [Spodoptera littoralis]CAH1643947.1 unnamed protein product [Spodoptera littoralis]